MCKQALLPKQPTTATPKNALLAEWQTAFQQSPRYPAPVSLFPRHIKSPHSPNSSQAVVDTGQLIQSGGIVCLSSFARMRISWDHHKPTSTSTSTTRARFDSSSPEPFPYNTAGSQRPIHAFEAAPNLFGASFHPPVPFPPRRNASPPSFLQWREGPLFGPPA
jgi:hypothetical protein